MAEVKVHLDDKEWKNFLDGLAIDSVKKRNIIRAVARVVAFKEVVQHFKDAKGPSGAWKQRASTTQDRYQKYGKGKTTRASRLKDGTQKEAGSPYAIPKGSTRAQWNPSNRLLQMTGALRKGFLQANMEDVDDGVVLFNPIEHASAHDEGNGVPKREFMWMSEAGVELAAKNALDLWTRNA